MMIFNLISLVLDTVLSPKDFTKSKSNFSFNNLLKGELIRNPNYFMQLLIMASTSLGRSTSLLTNLSSNNILLNNTILIGLSILRPKSQKYNKNSRFWHSFEAYYGCHSFGTYKIFCGILLSAKNNICLFRMDEIL